MHALRRAELFLERQTGATALGLGVVLLGAVAFADWFTGTELSFSLFYLLPVSTVAWAVGARGGIAAAIVCAIVWRAVDALGGATYSAPSIPYWNAAIRFGFFLTVAMLLARLRTALDVERQAAGEDYVTGVMSARRFYERGNLELARARRHGGRLTLIYMDLDNFKSVNDTLGHSAGDELLHGVGDVLRSSFRETDAVGRLGGDEFGVLVPHGDDETVLGALHRVQARLREFIRGNDWQVSVSVGCATFLRPPGSVDDMVSEADMLMYKAKSSGKDRIECREIE